MPLSQDLLTRIVDIKWDSGLAVEFYDGANGGEPAFVKTTAGKPEGSSGLVRRSLGAGGAR